MVEISFKSAVRNVSRVSAGILLASAVGFAAPAAAAPVSVNFTGTVEVLTTNGVPGVTVIDDVFAVGQSVTGSLTYDEANFGAAAISDINQQQFTKALFDLSVTIAGSTYTSSGGRASIFNDIALGSSAPTVDAVVFSGTRGVGGDLIDGVAPDIVQFSLGTGVLSTFADADVPTLSELLALGAVNGDSLPAGNFNASTNFIGFANNELVRFRIDSVTAASIPLPASGLLLVSGLIGIAAFRRRGQSQG